MSNQEALQLSDEDLQAIKDEVARLREVMFSSLAAEINGKLQSRMGFRKQKENQWLEATRLYLGSLSSYNIITSDWPMGLDGNDGRGKEGMRHRPEFNIIRSKCELAIAQTITNQFAAGDKNWALKAPPVCDLDQQDIAIALQAMQQSAPAAAPMPPALPQGAPQQPQNQPTTPPPPPTLEEIMVFKVDLMEKEIENHLINTKYGLEIRRAMMDRVVLGTGIMKGPRNVGKQKKIYEKSTTSDGKIIRIPKYIDEKVPCIYRVNPWFFFPDDTATDQRQAEDSVEVHPMTKTELRELASMKGFMAEQISLCLEEEPRQYTNSPFNDPAYLTQGVNTLKGKYLVLEYHGPIKKENLSMMGLDNPTEDPLDEIYGEVWVVNDRVIRVDLEDLEGCYRIPYKMCVWEPDPATPFGFGIPMLARDAQRVVNETYKMILDNAGISAGPQVVVDTTLIKPADGGMACTPWKVWYSTEFGADVTKAIQFFIPTNAFEGLSNLLSLARSFADDESSIQSLIGGGINAPQGQDSATGLMIMNQNATAPLFFKAEEWDDAVTYPIIQDMYDWEMQYNPKEEIKGSYEIDVRTSTSYLRSQIEQQKLDRLSQEIAQGSPIGEWINLDELAVARLSSMKLPYKGIVKTPQQVAQERANRPPPPPDPNLIKAQTEQQKVQIDAQRLQFEQQKAGQESQMKMQEAQMEYEGQLRTDATRDKEAQASAIKAQFDYMAQLAALAAKDDQHRASIVADLQKSQATLQTQKFLAGMEAMARAKDQVLKDKELKLKAKGKTGITSVR